MQLGAILTSQLPVTSWHAQIGDPTLADSILERLVHNAYRLKSGCLPLASFCRETRKLLIDH